MKSKVVYEADDGTTFDTDVECLGYEKSSEEKPFYFNERIAVSGSPTDFSSVNYCRVERNDIYIINGEWNLSHFSENDYYVIARDLPDCSHYSKGCAHIAELISNGDVEAHLIPKRYYRKGYDDNFSKLDMCGGYYISVLDSDDEIDDWSDDCPF